MTSPAHRTQPGSDPNLYFPVGPARRARYSRGHVPRAGMPTTCRRAMPPETRPSESLPSLGHSRQSLIRVQLPPSIVRLRSLLPRVDRHRRRQTYAVVPLYRGTVPSWHHRSEQSLVVLNYGPVGLQHVRRSWKPPLIICIQTALMT
jgi:hypothetical protein